MSFMSSSSLLVTWDGEFKVCDSSTQTNSREMGPQGFLESALVAQKKCFCLTDRVI